MRTLVAAARGVETAEDSEAAAKAAAARAAADSGAAVWAVGQEVAVTAAVVQGENSGVAEWTEEPQTPARAAEAGSGAAAPEVGLEAAGSEVEHPEAVEKEAVAGGAVVPRAEVECTRSGTRTCRCTPPLSAEPRPSPRSDILARNTPCDTSCSPRSAWRRKNTPQERPLESTLRRCRCRCTPTNSSRGAG